MKIENLNRDISLYTNEKEKKKQQQNKMGANDRQ